MRFSRLDLLRYGHFEGSSIELPERPLDLHLVVGPNESGKSTARSAVSDLLFGFGGKTRYAFLHDNSSLRIGAEIERESERLSFRRRKGNKGTLLDDADKSLGDNALAPYLAGADRAYFERMFSLDQPSLVAGAESMLDASDDIARMLFQASAGLSGLGDVLKALETEADGLFAPRKRQDRAYYKALELFETAERAQKEATIRVGDWEKARKAFDQAKQQLEEAVDRYGKVDREKARLARIARTAPLLRELRDSSEKLREAGEITRLPDDAAQTWSQATTAIALAKRREEDLLRELDDARAQLESLVIDDSLLAREAAVLALVQQQASTSRHPTDLAKRRAELALLEDDARKRAHALGWRLASVDEIAAKMPPELLLRRLKDLSAAWSALSIRRETAAKALTEASRKRDDLRLTRDRLHAEGAPAALLDALAHARSLGNPEARRGELVSALTKAETKLERMRMALRPFAGDMAALTLVLPPDTAVLSRFHRDLANLTDKLREHSSERTQLDENLQEVRVREQQIQRERAPVGPSDVAEARAKREMAWETAKQQLLAPSFLAKPMALVAEVETTTQEADRLADRRCEAIGAWAELEQIRNHRELLEKKLSAIDARLATVSADKAKQEQAFRELLRSSGVPEMAPEQVANWAKRREDTLEEADALALVRDRLAAFDGAQTAAMKQLRTALVTTGEEEAALRELGLAALVGRAEALAKRLDEERARRAQVSEQLSLAERDLEALEAKVRTAEGDTQAYGEQWQRALSEAGLPASLDPAEGSPIVDSLRELSAKLGEIADLRHKRIDTMERDLAGLQESALTLTREIASDLAALPPLELIDALAKRLDSAKKTREQSQRAQERIEELRKKLASAIEERQKADARLAPLHGVAKTESDEGLLNAIQRSTWRRDLEREIQTRENALRQVGDGLSLSDLEAEAQAEDLSTLETRLNETTQEFKSLAELREARAVELQNARTAFEAIGGGERAASAAGDRQQALAAMGSAVERWIRIRTAAKTLRWAIERFRQQKQDPLLQRAGDIFATLTLGELSKLAIDFDEKDQPRLVGIRRGTGSSVPIDGMSTGTADQLYLALRIAALELHLESRPALPFVADDIFIHFDDERAAAGFRVLADLSRRTQVIFFTHHEHLVEVARSAIDGELGSVVRLGT